MISHTIPASALHEVRNAGMTTRTATLLALLLSTCASFLPASTAVAEDAETTAVAAPPRLAIVDVGAKNAALHDLLYVSFPDEPPVTLLERMDVDRLLKEQVLSLWARGLSEADTVKAGKIGVVDAFLMLDTTPSPEGEQLRLRLVDTRYGLKLMDKSFLLPADRSLLGDVAANIGLQAARRLAAAHKSPEDMLLVSVGGFESVDLSERHPWIADEIPYRLEQALQLSSQVLLLERRKTRALQEERSLVQSLPAALSRAALQIDGEHSVTKNGDALALSITFRIRHGTNVVFSGTVDGGLDVPVLVRDMVGQMAAHFAQGRALPVMSPEREAAMFANEAAMARDTSRALEMAEAALALQPENVEYLFLVVARCCDFIRLLETNAQQSPDLYERDYDTFTRTANRLVRLATAAILRIPRSNILERSMYFEYMRTITEQVGALNRWADFHRMWELRAAREASPPTDHVPDFWDFWNVCRSSVLGGPYSKLHPTLRGYTHYLETFFRAEAATWHWCDTLDEVLDKCQRRLEDEIRLGAKLVAPESLVPYSTPGSKGAPDAPARVLAYLRKLEKSEDERIRFAAHRGLFAYSLKNPGVLDQAECSALGERLMPTAQEPATGPSPRILSWPEARVMARTLFYEKGDFQGATNILVETLAHMPDRRLPSGQHGGRYRTILSDLLAKIEREHATPALLTEGRYMHETLLTRNEGSGQFRNMGKAQNFTFSDLCVEGNVATISSFAGTEPCVLQYDLSKRSILTIRTYDKAMGQTASCLAVSGADVYMGFSTNGLLVFGDREDTHRHLTEGNGLVSQNVHSLCTLNGKVYALVGTARFETDGYEGLMEIDPSIGRSHLLLSRHSRVPSCEVDGNWILGAAADGEKGKLLISLNGQKPPLRGQSPVYLYDPATGDTSIFMTPDPKDPFYGSIVVSGDYYFVLSQRRSAHRISRHGSSDADWTIYSHPVGSQLPYPMDVPNQVSWTGLHRKGIMQLGDQILMLSSIRNILLYSEGSEKPELIHDSFFEHYDRVRPRIQRLVMSSHGLLMLTTDELYLFPELTAQGIKKQKRQQGMGP